MIKRNTDQPAGAGSGTDHRWGWVGGSVGEQRSVGAEKVGWQVSHSIFFILPRRHTHAFRKHTAFAPTMQAALRTSTLTAVPALRGGSKAARRRVGLAPPASGDGRNVRGEEEREKKRNANAGRVGELAAHHPPCQWYVPMLEHMGSVCVLSRARLCGDRRACKKNVACAAATVADASLSIILSHSQDGDWGARDATPGEIGSNFSEKVLGNWDTAHIIR